MKATTSVLLASLAFAMLAGCKKAPDAAQSSNDPTPGSSPAVSAAPPGGSVALPPDKAPASDAAIAPSTASSGTGGSAAEGKSGDANSQTQANPADLKKEQEQAAMPQTGQVNNHSAPDAAGTQGTPK